MTFRRSQRAFGAVAAGTAGTVGALAASLATELQVPVMAAPAVIAQRQRRQPNVLLVTIDTLRADRVGPGIAGGGKGARTPITRRPPDARVPIL